MKGVVARHIPRLNMLRIIVGGALERCAGSKIGKLMKQKKHEINSVGDRINCSVWMYDITYKYIVHVPTFLV